MICCFNYGLIEVLLLFEAVLWGILVVAVLFLFVSFLMLINMLFMFVVMGISYKNVKLSSKLFNVIVKMYLVYYLMCFFIYLLYIFSYISFNSVIIIIVNSIRLNVFSYYLVLAISLIAFLIILNSINYLSYIESFYFIFLLLCFYLTMYMFIVSFNILTLFICWEYLGLVSYLLINYWLTRINCGIKTLLYNRIGDCCFLLVISLFYAYYYTFSLITFNLYIVIFSYIFMLFVLFMFIVIFFTKSAILPFSSWLISAMAAPTPVSSLLHSSTMVIAGIIFGYLSFSSIIVYILFNYYYSYILYNLFLFLILLTLLYSCFYLLYVSDIKSLIAYSTINQLTYIFFGLFSFNSVFSIYHIITHAAFKSLLFLLAGSLIHISLNYQSFYRLKSYCYLLKSLFIISLLLSLFNYSKEFILNYSYLSLSLSAYFYIFTFCIIISFIYSLKLFVAIFTTSFSFVSFTSFILIFYGLTVLSIDSMFYNIFASTVSPSYNSFNLSYNLIAVDSGLSYVAISFVVPIVLFSGLIYACYSLLYMHSQLLPKHRFHNSFLGFLFPLLFVVFLFSLLLYIYSYSFSFLAFTVLFAIIMIIWGIYCLIYLGFYIPITVNKDHSHQNNNSMGFPEQITHTYIKLHISTHISPLISYFNLLSISYFNYFVFLVESLFNFSIIPSITFIYAFIPLSIAIFLLFII